MPVQIALALLGAVLFAGSHPNILFKNGLFLLGFFSLVPVFLLVKKSSLKMSLPLGFFYGFLSYSLFSFWLYKYSVSLYLSAVLFYASILGIVFFIMKFTSVQNTSSEMFVMALVWCVYEYLKTLGPLGFSYGILGYTQWQNPILLSFSSVCGVWGASLVCCLVSALVASIVIDIKSVKTNIFPLALVSMLLLFVSLQYFYIQYGAKNRENPSKTARVMVVQNNTDSNKTGFDVYKKDIRKLVRLTDIAGNDCDFVLWPETAVVPPILYYYNNKIDHERYNVIVDALNFISRRNSCFVIGNQHSEKDKTGQFSDYNAVLVFDSRKKNVNPPNPEIYKKIHLVPFSEYLPIKFLDFLSDSDSFWKAGEKYNVFFERNVCFCTPICFEDTFGSLCRKFVRNGAECFFDISNDSWSQSSVSQRQHLSMAVFRSAENRIPTVRSSGSGVSCLINGFGIVMPDSIPEFREGTAIYDVVLDLNKRDTFYTLYGDWLCIMEICILIWLFACIVLKRFMHVEN